jgi:hypothetical protein
MSIETFGESFTRDFATQINLLTQQEDSFFKSIVPQRSVTGETFDYNNLGALKVQRKTIINEDVQVSNAFHERRGGKMYTDYISLHIDGQVAASTLLDLQSGYMQGMAAAFMRHFDVTVAKTALDPTWTGKDLQTLKPFSGFTVDATAGLTFAKLLEVRRLLRSKGVGLFKDEQIYLAISEIEESQILSELKFTSKDFSLAEYNTKRSEMERALGMTIITLPSAPDNDTGILQISGGVRKCFAFSSKALQIGVRRDLKFEIDRLQSKVDTTQIKAFYDIGGLRSEDAKVVAVNTAI